MKQTTKYVALDVHQATTVAAVREEGGRVIARGILPAEAPAIVEFLRGMRGCVHVAFEEGTQAQWLHDMLVPVVDRVVVCDRRGQSQHGNKGDQQDADQLSELLRRDAAQRSRASRSVSTSRAATGIGAASVAATPVAASRARFRRVPRGRLAYSSASSPGACRGYAPPAGPGTRAGPRSPYLPWAHRSCRSGSARASPVRRTPGGPAPRGSAHSSVPAGG